MDFTLLLSVGISPPKFTTPSDRYSLTEVTEKGRFSAFLEQSLVLISRPERLHNIRLKVYYRAIVWYDLWSFKISYFSSALSYLNSQRAAGCFLCNTVRTVKKNSCVFWQTWWYSLFHGKFYVWECIKTSRNWSRNKWVSTCRPRQAFRISFSLKTLQTWYRYWNAPLAFVCLPRALLYVPHTHLTLYGVVQFMILYFFSIFCFFFFCGGVLICTFGSYFILCFILL